MMLPSCFSNPNTTNLPSTAMANNISEMPQNLVTCTYQTSLLSDTNNSSDNSTLTFLTLTWCKTPASHSLTIHTNDLFSTSISLHHPSHPFSSLFKTRAAGSKSINTDRNRLKLYWDFTKATFTGKSAEPCSNFYLIIVTNAQIKFLLGDLKEEAVRRCGSTWIGELVEPTLVGRREHVFGRRNYSTVVQFLGCRHEIGIECGGGVLRVKVDGLVSLVVRRLGWKFRGNERIVVGGIDVEFYWDVFNWVSGCRNNNDGHGVFVFQVGDGGVWPEIVGVEKRLMKKLLLSSSSSSSFTNGVTPLMSPSLSSSCSSSVLQWAEESSDGGRSSCSSSTTRSCGNGTGGFSLLLYAWRNT